MKTKFNTEFTIRDSALPTVDSMRKLFESTIRNTPRFSECFPLAVSERKGKFDRYVDDSTEAMWIGYALALRCAERIAVADGGSFNDLVVRVVIPPSASPRLCVE